MRKLIFILALFITSCVVNHELLVKDEQTVGQPTVSEEITTLAAPTNRMIVVENGRSSFRDIHEVMDENDALFNSDTLSVIATKEDIGAISVSSYERDNDSSKIVFLDGSELKLRDATVTFNTVSDIVGTFPNGTLIQTRGFTTVGDGAGALYQVQSSAPVTPDDTSVINLGTNYAVLQPQNGQYDVRWFGAIRDGVTDNSAALQKAVNFAAGNKMVFIPNGDFSYGTTLLFGDKGLHVEGAGASVNDVLQSRLIYTGNGDAISIGVGNTSGLGKITLRNFTIKGNASAIHGIDLDFITHGGLSQNDIIENIRIEDFTNAGSAGIYLVRAYNMTIERPYIANCNIGIFLGTETVEDLVLNPWIRNSISYGIQSTYAGNSTVKGGVIDHVGSPSSSQRGVYMSGSAVLHLDGIHFEGNYMHIETTSGTKGTIRACRFNSQTLASDLADGSHIKLIGNFLPDNQPINVGLGTEWIGDIEGNHSIPTISADLPVGFATYNYLDGSAGAWTLQDYVVSGLPDGEFTLEFLDDSVTIKHESAGGGGRIFLKGNLAFKGHTGDKITFKKKQNIGGTADIIETSRTRARNIIRVQSRTYNVSLGESELTFSNNLASDTVDFYLPTNGLTEDYPIFTFVKERSLVVRLVPPAGRGIQGSGFADIVELVSGSVTLRADSLYYRIIAQSGVLDYDDPGVGYIGGVISGVGLDRLSDSLGLATYTADRLPYGVGSQTFGTNSAFTYNQADGANARRINIDNGNFGRARFGFADVSNVPALVGYQDLTFATSQPALQLVGFKHGGSFSSPTDVTEAQAYLLGIHARAHRGGSYRNAAAIIMGGDNQMSSTGYSGYIGFNTALTTTFARRATIHKNGDFYIGTGLASTDLESPSSKLLIRGDGTTTGFGILFEDSGGTDKFLIQDNGNMYLAGNQSIANSSAPTATTDQSKIWAQDVAAGQSELFARGETGNAEQLTGSTRILNADANSTSTSYAAISDLTFNVEAGKKYVIRGFIRTTSIPLSGIKVNLDGSATVTSLLLYFNENRTVPTTALGTAIFSNNTVDTDRAIELFGTVVINAAGTIGLQFGQVDTDGGTTTIGAGSYLELKPITN